MGFSSLVIVKIFRFNVILIYWKYLSVKQQNQSRRQEEEEEQNDLKAITLPRNVLLFIGLKFNYGQLQLNVKANDLQVINLRFVYSYLLSRIDRLSPCRIQGRIYWLPERTSVIANGNGNGGWAAIFAEVEACHKFYWMKLFPSFFFGTKVSVGDVNAFVNIYPKHELSELSFQLLSGASSMSLQGYFSYCHLMKVFNLRNEIIKQQSKYL